jgi:hypothetical protein
MTGNRRPRDKRIFKLCIAAQPSETEIQNKPVQMPARAKRRPAALEGGGNDRPTRREPADQWQTDVPALVVVTLTAVAVFRSLLADAGGGRWNAYGR